MRTFILIYLKLFKNNLFLGTLTIQISLPTFLSNMYQTIVYFVVTYIQTVCPITNLLWNDIILFIYIFCYS